MMGLDGGAAVVAAHQLHELESLLSTLLVAPCTGNALFGSCHESKTQNSHAAFLREQGPGTNLEHTSR